MAKKKKPRPAPLSERNAAAIGPRILKDPRSVGYAWQTVSLLKDVYGLREVSLRDWAAVLADAQKYEIYNRIPAEKPYGSMDAMLKAEIGVTYDESLQNVAARLGLRILEAAQATTGEVLPQHKHPHPQFASQTQAERARQNGVGKRTQEKLDALARKAPHQLERVRAGEVSVTRACIEAGIEKGQTPLEQLKRWWARATASQRRAFRAWLEKENSGGA
jgi:hypothetical protein